MVVKYLDTYALAEIAEGNPKFANFIISEFVISDMTLAEFYAVLLRETGEKTAEHWFSILKNYSKPVDKELLKEAIIFRFNNKKKNISFFDAVGYIYAQKNSMVFVTGDKEFEKLPGVEYIKK